MRVKPNDVSIIDKAMVVRHPFNQGGLHILLHLHENVARGLHASLVDKGRTTLRHDQQKRYETDFHSP